MKTLSPRLATIAFACALATGMAPHVARAADPDAPHHQRSYDLEAEGHYREALAALESVSAADKRGYFYLLRRAWLSYLNGNSQQAIESYRAAAAAEPAAIEPLMGLTLPQMALQQWPDAIATTQAILQRDAGNTVARSRLAFCLYSQGKYAEALEHYQRVLTAYPSDVDMRAGLAWSQLMLGRTAHARTNFQAVLHVAPNHASAKEGLAAIPAGR